MRVCFIHQNIPGQFRHLVEALLLAGDEVVVVGEKKALARWQPKHPRLSSFGYAAPADDTLAATPAHLRELDLQIARGHRVAMALRMARKKGLVPDLVVAHPGWGEALFVKAELPDTPMLAYCEFFYRARGSDVGFDPEFSSSEHAAQRLQIRKLPHLAALSDMDAGLSPTRWQRAQYPRAYRPLIDVMHDGVDTRQLTPRPGAEVELAGHTLRLGDPVVTYVARNLEPYRGFHVFMRCLPLLQRLAPRAIVVIVGGDEVSYGARLPNGQTFRQKLLDELGDRLDTSRVLFTGKLPYATYVELLRVSAVHAYLTYPFVLSWSLLEAMSVGCCVVASRTAPVEEVIDDGANGLLVDFFDAQALAERLADVLAARVDAMALRHAARAHVVANHDLRSRCLPAGLALLRRVAARGKEASPLPNDAPTSPAALPVAGT